MPHASTEALSQLGNKSRGTFALVVLDLGLGDGLSTSDASSTLMLPSSSSLSSLSACFRLPLATSKTMTSSLGALTPGFGSGRGRYGSATPLPPVSTWLDNEQTYARSCGRRSKNGILAVRSTKSKKRSPKLSNTHHLQADFLLLPRNLPRHRIRAS